MVGDFQQDIEDYTMVQEQSLQQTVLQNLDICMQKNKDGPLLTPWTKND